ncbi:MAG: hypothetical protein R8M38_00950 [Mariprofundaceae bacterium]
MKTKCLVIFTTLLLASCGGGENSTTSEPGTSGTSRVTIDLGSKDSDNNQRSRALSMRPTWKSPANDSLETRRINNTVPASVQSMCVAAYMSGFPVAGPAFANAPSFALTMNIPNGLVTFEVTAFSGISCSGNPQYMGRSSTIKLDENTIDIDVPMTMSMLIEVVAPVFETKPGTTVTNIVASVAGNSSSSLPISWSATGGELTALASISRSSSTDWIAPDVPGLYTIGAQLDPAALPEQDPSFFGSVDIFVTETPGAFVPGLPQSIMLSTPENTKLSYPLNSVNAIVMIAPVNGELFIDATGNVVYAPFLDFNGQDFFSIEALDSAGSAAAVPVLLDFVITVGSGIPTSGQFKLISLSTPMDTPVETTINIPGGPFEYKLIAPPMNGDVKLDGFGAASYAQMVGFIGVDTFMVELFAPQKNQPIIVQFDINVGQISEGGELPQFVNLSTMADTPISYQLIFPLEKLSLLRSPQNGNVTLQLAGLIEYLPLPGFTGQDKFAVEGVNPATGQPVQIDFLIDVGTGGPGGQQVTQLITSMDTPVQASPNLPGNIAGLPVEFILLEAPRNGKLSIDPLGKFLEYTPSLNYIGSDFFVIEVKDTRSGTVVTQLLYSVEVIAGSGGTGQQQFVNLSTSMDTTATYQLNIPGGPYKYSMLAPAASGSAVVDPSGLVNYSPFSGSIGQDFFIIEASDPTGQLLEIQFIVDVVASSGGGITPVPGSGQTQTINLQTIMDTKLPFATPIPLKEATLALPPFAGTVTFDPSGGGIYMPKQGFVGTDDFTIEGADLATGMFIQYRFFIDVQAVETTPPPAGGGQTQTISLQAFLDQSVSYPTLLADVNLFSPPSAGEVTVDAMGVVTYWASPGFAGTDRFTVDGKNTVTGQRMQFTFIVDVQPSATTPSPGVNILKQTVSLQTTMGIAVSSATSLLGASVVSAATNGQASVGIVGGVTYSPFAAFTGTDKFTVEGKDSATGQMMQFTFIVDVLPNATTPPPGGTQLQTITLLTSMGKQVSYQTPLIGAYVLTQGKGLASVNQSGRVDYIPAAAFVGQDGFAVEGKDSATGQLMQYTFVVTVK